MAERIRFHLDENVNPVIAAALRRQGIDVTATVEMDLRTASDEEQLEFIRAEGRVLVTHDTDFLRIASQTDDHPGITFLRRNRFPFSIFHLIFCICHCPGNRPLNSS